MGGGGDQRIDISDDVGFGVVICVGRDGDIVAAVVHGVLEEQLRVCSGLSPLVDSGVRDLEKQGASNDVSLESSAAQA